MVTTPFEDSGGTAWTTLAQERIFLDAVAAESPRVSTLRLGSSAGGNGMYAYAITPSGVPVPDVVGGVFAVGAQHGNEVAGREACLQWIRDLAAAPTAPPLPVVVIPTGNPDGVAAGVRQNAAGQDVNRTHAALSSPEAWAIDSVWHRSDPLLVVDLHESDPSFMSSTTSPVDFRAYEYVAAPGLRAEGDALIAALRAEFPNSGLYPALTEHEGPLTSVAPARGNPMVLAETRITDTPLSRVANALTVLQSAYAWAQVRDLQSVRVAARVWNRGEGFAAHVPVWLYENGYQAAPVGFRIRYGDVPWSVLGAHGIRAVDVSSWGHDQYVPMDQPTYAVIPWLLDPRAPRPVAPAVPVFPGDEPAVDLGIDRFHSPRLLSVGRTPARRVVAGGGIVWGT